MEPALVARLAKLFEANPDPVERNEAARELLGRLFTLTTPFARRDAALADDLVGHVAVGLCREMYRPTTGKEFDAWVRAVMRNYAVSEARVRLAGGRELPEELPAAPDDAPSLDLRIDLATPFCAADAARVAAWTVPQRVVLLPWHLLWRKVEKPRWDEAVRAAGLQPTFPGRDLPDLPAADRTCYLAEALDVTPNAVTQALARGRRRVLALRFIRELGQVAW